MMITRLSNRFLQTGCFIFFVVFCFACTRLPESPSQSMALTNSSWVFVHSQSNNALSLPIPGSEITAVFTPTHISGKAGCNQYRNAYTINGRFIQIDELTTTLIDCPALLMVQESQFLEALQQATTFSILEDELVLETAVSTLTFHRLQPLPLEGTNWQLNGIVQDGVLIESWVDEEITAVFTNGELSGHAGCNTIGGSYTIDSTKITELNILATAKMCNSERNQREQQFLDAFSKIEQFATTHESLTLSDIDNNPLLTFTKAPPPNPLSDVTWELVALETPDGPLPTRGTVITAEFQKERISGTGGCNIYAASTFLSADAFILLVNDIGHSLENCDNTTQQLETTYFNLLETAESFTIENKTLTIFSQRGKLTFTKK